MFSCSMVAHVQAATGINFDTCFDKRDARCDTFLPAGTKRPFHTLMDLHGLWLWALEAGIMSQLNMDWPAWLQQNTS